MKKIVICLISLACVLISCQGKNNSQSSFSSENNTSISQNNSIPSSNDLTHSSNPLILGAEDIKILQGEYFNPYQNVSAFGSENENLTTALTVEGFVDYSQVGTYELSYHVSDIKNNETSVIRHIEVLPNEKLYENETPYIYHSSIPYNISFSSKVTGNFQDNNYPNNVTDGDITTRYESPWEETTSELTIDLGASLKTTSYKITFENASALNYKIYTSLDNQSFSEVKNFVTSQGGARIDEESLEAQGRYFKFQFLEKSMPSYGYSVYEIELYGYDGLVVPTHEYRDLYESKMINDVQYLELTLNTPVTFNSINFSCPDGVNPQNYQIYVNDELVLEINNGSTNPRLNETMIATKIKFVFNTRHFYSKYYAISTIDLRLNDIGVNYDGIFQASSNSINHEPSKARGDYATYWASEETSTYQTIVLDEIKTVGSIDMKWNVSHGKIYDLEISSDGINFSLFYRQIHGATMVQKVYLNRAVKAIRLIDYSNESSIRYQLENIILHSPYPNDPVIDYQIPNYDKEIKVIKLKDASYITNTSKIATARYVAYLEDDLMNKPIPSNGIWQSLLINNFGHAMYFNPLRLKYSSDGLNISLPGAGYFETTYNRSQVVTDFVDLTLMMETKKQEAQTKVLDYSESSVTVSYSSIEGNEFISTFASGSPYSYHTFLSDTIHLKANNLLGIYDFNGREIKDQYQGDGIVLKISRLEKNETSGQTYEDRYYAINTSKDTKFVFQDNIIEITNMKEHYLSIGGFINFSNANLFHESGYAFVYDTLTEFIYNEVTNEVTTKFVYLTLDVKKNKSNTLICVLPHHYKKMRSFTSVENYHSVRGLIKTLNDNNFETIDKFYGIVPEFGEPTNKDYSREELLGYLNNYVTKMERSSNLSADAYWQGKALHPLANAALIADQIGDISLRDRFIALVKTILVEWYTYSGNNDNYYFYFDTEWKTLYYGISEFGANNAISDHHFTYGYYAFASAVVATYDEEFVIRYGDMCHLLIDDYLNIDENCTTACTLRNYDVYAGHSWAGGYADNDSGNNQESAGEALNSYASAYLYALATNDISMRDTAIACYVTELNAIKQYWFDYDKENFGDYPYAGAGQIYGASNFYGTFFNGNPTYIYGIQWLPGGEFLSGYAIGKEEQTRLKEIYESYQEESLEWANTMEEGYQHILWVILAMFDSDEAISRLKERGQEIINHDEMFLCYYLIHAFASEGYKSNRFVIDGNIGTVIYEKDDFYYVTTFNPTKEDKVIKIIDSLTKEVKEVRIPKNSFIRFNLKDFASDFTYHFPNSSLTLSDANTKNVYESYTTYTYRMVFDPNSSYFFSMSVINTTNEKLKVTILDQNKNVITTIMVPENDNLILESEQLALSFKQEIYLQVDNGLVIMSLSFNS